MKKWLLLLVVCMVLLPVFGYAEYVFPAGEEAVDCGDFSLTLQAGDLYRLEEKVLGAMFFEVFPDYDEKENVHASIGVQWINDGSLANIKEEDFNAITFYSVSDASQMFEQMNLDVEFLSVEPMHKTEMFGTWCYCISYTMRLKGSEEPYVTNGEIKLVSKQLMVPVNDQEYYIFTCAYEDDQEQGIERILSTFAWKE